MTIGVGSLPSFVVRFPQGVVQTIGVGADAVMREIVARGGQAEMVLKEACDGLIQQLIAQKGLVPAALSKCLKVGGVGVVLAGLGVAGLYYAGRREVAGPAMQTAKSRVDHSMMIKGSALLAGTGLALAAVALYRIHAVGALFAATPA